MTNQEIEDKLRALIGQERKITVEILALIHKAQKRRIFLERGYSSLFEWLVKEMGYSQSAAYRRIQTAQLISIFPEGADLLQKGQVNLSTLSELQSCWTKEEKRTGVAISRDVKKRSLSLIENKNFDEAQRIIKKEFPETVGRRESLRPVNGEESRLTIIISSETKLALERSREILSHVLPSGTWAEIIDRIAKEFLERKDPLKKAMRRETESVQRRVITPTLRAKILQRAQGQCEFLDETSQRRCECRYQIEVDHVIPKALGGSNHHHNLRALCRPHNLFEAERILGTYQASRAK